MSDEAELTEADVARWCQRLAAAPALDHLFSEADVEGTRNDLEPFDVSEEDERVTVTLYRSYGEGHYLRAVGVYDADDSILLRADLEEGYVAAPLAGHGMVWTWEDGAVTESRWIS